MKSRISPLFAVLWAAVLCLSGQAQIVFVSNLSSGGNGQVNAYTSPGSYTVLGTYANPEGLAVDSSGNLFVAVASSNQILKFTGGTGPGVVLATTTAGPTDLVMDNAGNLYALLQDKSVVKFTGATGSGTTLITSTTATSAGISNALGLAIDGAGNLYIGDYSPTGTIQKFNASGASVGQFATGVNYPTNMTFDGSGNLYVSNAGAQNILKFGLGGGSGTVFATISTGNPEGIFFNSANATFYVAINNASDRVEMFNLAGADIGTYTTAGLYNPNGVAISAVPEPSTCAAMLGLGALSFAAWRKRRSSLPGLPRP